MTDFFKNDFFKAYQDFAKKLPNADAFKNMDAFKGFQAPQVDMNKFFTLQRKNIEAFSAASKALNEGAQAIARRNADFMRDNMEDVLSNSRTLMSSGSAPDKAAAKQADFTKNFVKNTSEQLREVSEMASKTQFEAFDILSSRFTRATEEAKEFTASTAPKGTKKAA
jgi:phasin family protein